MTLFLAAPSWMTEKLMASYELPYFASRINAFCLIDLLYMMMPMMMAAMIAMPATDPMDAPMATFLLWSSTSTIYRSSDLIKAQDTSHRKCESEFVDVGLPDRWWMKE